LSFSLLFSGKGDDSFEKMLNEKGNTRYGITLPAKPHTALTLLSSIALSSV
jgi:hypothetical protein